MYLRRFVALSVALGVCAWQTQQSLAAAVLPLLRAEIQQLGDTFRVDRLYVARDAGEWVIRLEVGLAHALAVNGRTYSPDPRGKAVSSTLLANLILPVVLLLASAYAAPPGNVKARFAFVLILLTLTVATVVPAILLSGLWRLVFGAAGTDAATPLLLWSDFLQGGGANVLGLACGVTAAKLSEGCAPREQRHQQPAGPAR